MEKRAWSEQTLAPHYITPQEAAERIGVHAESIRRWIRLYGIGRKIVGRYRVDPVRLDMLLHGQDSLEDDVARSVLRSGVTLAVATATDGGGDDD